MSIENEPKNISAKSPEGSPLDQGFNDPVLKNVENVFIDAFNEDPKADRKSDLSTLFHEEQGVYTASIDVLHELGAGKTVPELFSSASETSDAKEKKLRLNALQAFGYGLAGAQIGGDKHFDPSELSDEQQRGLELAETIIGQAEKALEGEAASTTATTNEDMDNGTTPQLTNFVLLPNEPQGERVLHVEPVKQNKASPEKKVDTYKSLPLWKVTAERGAKDSADKEQIERRKQWLGAAFAAGGDMADLGVSKKGLVRMMRENLSKPIMPGAKTMLDRRLQNDKTVQLARQFLDRFDQENVSLRDLLQQAKSFQELSALKVFSAAWLEPYMTSTGRKPWSSMNEQQKRLSRLGELLGLEIERRQIELSGDKMEMDVAERARDRYAGVLKSEDVPDVFARRFEQTVENLEGRYDLEPMRPSTKAGEGGMSTETHPEAAAEAAQRHDFFTRAVDMVLQTTNATTLENASDENIDTTINSLQKGKEFIFANDADLREEFQDMHDGVIDYDPAVIDQLKQSYRSPSETNEVYRQRFLDSMSSQMSHVSYQNSEPGLWSKAIRGWVDTVDTRWQLFGWRGVFRPTWAREKMKKIRRDVVSSWVAVAQAPSLPYKNSALAHIIELGLVNVREEKTARIKLVARAQARQESGRNPGYRVSDKEFDDMIENYRKSTASQQRGTAKQPKRPTRASRPQPRKKAA